MHRHLYGFCRYISIHALREEGDRLNPCWRNRKLDFYPRPPRGGRRSTPPVYVVRETISIHALREEGDLVKPKDFHGETISIHALREEGDVWSG